jgi:putrescine transport system substrate-binding protein
MTFVAPLRPGGRSRTAMLFVVLLALAACGRHDGQSNVESASGAKPLSSPGQDSERILNVYNWVDYIGPNTVARFEKETGIKVNYDTYDNNEVLETKLLTGHTNYDVVLPTGSFFERMRVAGVYRKLDKGALPNLGNSDPDIMRRLAVYDPDNLYAVPYMFSTTGLGYNIDQVRARLGTIPLDSWALLFDPASTAKLKDCGISVVDSATDVFSSAMIYLSRDPNRLDPLDVAAASKLLMAIRPFVRNIDPAPITDLANGNTCLLLGWSGDVETAQSRATESRTGARIAYFVPKEGALMTLDMMAIPADAPHPHNAQIWMNFLMRPDVMAAITNAIHYPNGYTASSVLVDASIKSDPAVYPDEPTRARLVVPVVQPPEYTRLITREWTRFRTGN